MQSNKATKGGVLEQLVMVIDWSSKYDRGPVPILRERTMRASSRRKKKVLEVGIRVVARHLRQVHQHDADAPPPWRQRILSGAYIRTAVRSLAYEPLLLFTIYTFEYTSTATHVRRPFDAWTSGIWRASNLLVRAMCDNWHSFNPDSSSELWSSLLGGVKDKLRNSDTSVRYILYACCSLWSVKFLH
jgi:hypothetical protein